MTRPLPTPARPAETRMRPNDVTFLARLLLLALLVLLVAHAPQAQAMGTHPGPVTAFSL